MANQEENQLPSHFCRTILSLQNDRMKIPSKFVKQHGSTMSKDVILQVGPGKLTWRLGVKRCEGQVCLLDGWKDFAEYYSIEFGHILMFGYKGKSEFDVSIYDPSDMEIQYPVNASSKSRVEFDHSEVVETEEEETDYQEEEDEEDDDDEWLKRRHTIREKFSAIQSSKSRNRRATSAWDKETDDDEEEEEKEEEGGDGCPLRRDKLRGKSSANRSSKKRSHRATFAWHKGTDDEVEDDECQKRRNKIREKSCANQSSKKRNLRATHAWDIETEEDDDDDDDEWPQRRHKIRGKSCANQLCKKRNRRPTCAWDKETEEEDDDDDDEWPQRRQKSREKSRANQSSNKRTPLATSAWNKETDDEVEDGECSQRRHIIREKSCANQSIKKRNRRATCVLDKETEEDDDDDDDECPQRRHIIREKSRANQSSKKRNRHATSPRDKEINDEEDEKEDDDDEWPQRQHKIREKSHANQSSKKRNCRATSAWDKETDDEVEDDEWTQRRHKIREKSCTNKYSKKRNQYDTTPTSAWDRVLKRAEAYESSNPCFSVRMLPKSSLCFPHTHSIRHFLGKENNGVYLKVGGNERNWFVKYSIGPHPFYQVHLLEFGWSVFMKDNHLEDGDICIFELINSKKMVYKVTIFRIADYEEVDDDDGDEDDDENDERPGLNRSKEKRSQYSTNERTKALQRAHASRCQNPFFTVVINKYHLDGKSKTFVPRAHAKTYLFETGNSGMYLTDGKKDERTWLIPYSIEGPWLQARIWTPEWRAFKDDNYLQLGDVCVFELVDSSRMEYKVTIFRVADCA